MKRLLLGLAVAGLLLPAAATAGGFATVQLSSLPQGTDAGGTWTPTMTILQHGLTPLDGLQPVIRIANQHGEADSFAARPNGEPGGYVATVTFPSAGTWRYEIWDGFSQTHTYSPVTIGGGDGGSRRDGRTEPRVAAVRAPRAPSCGDRAAGRSVGGYRGRLGTIRFRP